MASKFRYRYGDTKPVKCRVSSSFPIEEGDIVCLDVATGVVKPAKTYVSTIQAVAAIGAASIVQALVGKHCMGIAMQKVGVQSGEKTFRINPDEGYCMVATGGVFEMDCAANDSIIDTATVIAAGNLEGAMLGIAATTGVVTDSQKVEGVTDAAACIGFVRQQRPDLLQTNQDRTVVIMELSPGAPYGGAGRLGLKGAGTYTNVSGDT